MSKPADRTPTPVLCTGFNRPDLFAEVLAAARTAGPRELFISIDGPRPGHAEDLELTCQVRELAEAVDWATEVTISVHDQNMGISRAVVGAISWVLEMRPEVIILEDDCLPDSSFLGFCDELLSRYRHDERVMQVAGTNWGAAPERFDGYSYAFTSFAPVWGWATWRRAWNLFDTELESWPTAKASGVLEEMQISNRFRRVLERDWEAARVSGGAWDYFWQYSVLSHYGFSACPERNLVKNIGFRRDATQTMGQDHVFSSLPRESLSFPLRHPPEVAHSKAVELVFERIYWQKRGWPARLLTTLVRNPRLDRLIRSGARRILPRPS